MKKKILAAALTAITSATLIVGTPMSASAQPRNCSIGQHSVMPAYGRVSYCASGTGYHRIVLVCNPGRLYGLPNYVVRGNWAKPGRYSSATCYTDWASGFYRYSYISLAG